MSEGNWSGLLDINTEFLEKVYAEVSNIPAGKVTTYGVIAELAGYPKASREVGIALSRAPQGRNLPCHRVVNKSGTLAPSFAFGSQEHQRSLLLGEGITFRPDNTIDIQKHMWPESIQEDKPKDTQLSLFDL